MEELSKIRSHTNKVGQRRSVQMCLAGSQPLSLRKEYISQLMNKNVYPCDKLAIP